MAQRGRKPLGDRAMTAAERKAKHRQSDKVRNARRDAALEAVTRAETIHDARRIAADALGYSANSHRRDIDD